jgi:glycosyltransferase involved in cell wall biosynthesis
MIEKITFCIPSKSNLRYLKTCIPSIRKNSSRNDHEIIIFVDSDEDGTVEWLEQVKNKYNIIYFINPNLGKSLFGIGKAYDYCVKKSTTDIFMIFHADMMLGKNADLKVFNYLKSKTVVCATRIEPPLHPNNGEKILMDFGMYPEEFKEMDFNQYVEKHLGDDKTTNGIFAPWMMYKQEFLEMGGHDPIMHSCREDSDIFNRMKLNGFKFIQPWNSLVYHLTGRGAGSFNGDEERHKKWKKDMDKSTLEFIRKWGTNVKHTLLMEPIISPKYDIGFRVKNCNLELLELLEPWCSNILIDDEMQVLTTHYIDKEQKNTSFNLTDRILSTPFQTLNNEIIVEIDRLSFTQQEWIYLTQLPDIICENNDIGVFELGELKISINQMNEYQNDLIFINK